MKNRSWFDVNLLLVLSALAHFSKSASGSTASCDESKCRATRSHPWVDGDTEWTCWVPVENSTNITNLCSGDFEGRIVEDVLPEEIENVVHVWITCCPPDFDGTISQQCSDRACSSPDWEGGGNCWADGFQEPMSCSSTKYRYPRWTGLMSLIYLQYVCCTSPSHNDKVMEELLVARVIWIVLSSITFLVCFIFILAILSDRITRTQGYNLYLVFLAIPDAVVNLFTVIRNSLTITGAPVSPTVHIFLASIEYFYAAANMWLNGLIVGQIHLVLRKSNRFIKVSPPSVTTVCKQAAGIYAFALGWFGWAFFLYYRGLVIFPLDRVVNIWIVTRVFMVAPPLLYVIYVCVDVWRRNLLPRSGRTRILSLYFLRVVIVFLVTWVPYFIIYEIAWNVTHSRWMVHISYYLGSIQGFMSVAVALSKPDIKRAVFRVVFCCQKTTLHLPHSGWNSGSTLPTTTTTSLPSSTIATSRPSLPTTPAEVPQQDDEVRLDLRATLRINNRRMRSSILFHRPDEWDMEDVWDSRSGNDDDFETEPRTECVHNDARAEENQDCGTLTTGPNLEPIEESDHYPSSSENYNENDTL